MQPATTVPAYQALAHDIKSLGTEAVFGLMSDDTALFVTTLNSSTGVGPDSKGFNAAGVLQAAGIRTFVATDSHTARQTLSSAIAAAQHGAIALVLPMNVQFGRIPFDGVALPPDPRGSPPASKLARTAAIQSAAALLQKSRKPLFVAGLGAHRAGARDAVIRLANKVGAGLATTLKGKDMFRGHPFDAGIVGSFSHAGGRRLIDQADCVVVFGAGLNQRTTSFGSSLPIDVPLIHVDSVRSNIGRWFNADVAVVADARMAAEQLLEVLPDRAVEDKPLHSDEMRRWLADFDIASEFQPAHTPRTVDPRSLAMELDRLLPKDRNAVYDSGNFLQSATGSQGEMQGHPGARRGTTLLTLFDAREAGPHIPHGRSPWWACPETPAR